MAALAASDSLALVLGITAAGLVRLLWKGLHMIPEWSFAIVLVWIIGAPIAHEGPGRTMQNGLLALKDGDMNVRFALLQRLERPELIQQSLLDAAFPIVLKQQLLAQITDEKQLEKLSKQLEPSLAEALQARLALMAADKQKPPHCKEKK